MGDFKGFCSSTGIGSLPHKQGKPALELLVDNFDIPFWPQLPNKSFFENMYAQFSEKMPGIVINLEEEGIYFDTNKAMADLESFYEKVIAEDSDYFRISGGHARGFYTLLEHDYEYDLIKGHVTGPISFGFTVTDENKKAIAHNTDIFEAIVEGLYMKALWQIDNLKEVSKDVVIFIDEPYMSSYGSAYVPITKDLVVNSLGNLIGKIQEHAHVGVHCCGNTDWDLVMGLKPDIVSFDAYNFSDKFSLYSASIDKFITNGGNIAWGIVPTSNDIINADSNNLSYRLESVIDSLTLKKIDQEKLLEHSLITPSCGAGSLSLKAAKKVVQLTSEISEKMIEDYIL